MKGKSEIITFKADPALSQAMAGVPNRSEFIREAILAALQNSCPLCSGTGVLTLEQKRHWETFSQRHAVVECSDCHATHLTCGDEGHAHPRPRATKGLRT